jgi:hypothetical protein
MQARDALTHPTDAALRLRGLRKDAAPALTPRRKIDTAPTPISYGLHRAIFKH